MVGESECALIDAGVGDPRHLESIDAELQRRNGRLAHVLITHAHVDHIDGVMVIAERWPRATFSKIRWPERDVKYRIRWTALSDMQQLVFADVGLEVVHTPGHAPDHACFWNQQERVLFGGDLVTPGNTVVIPGSHGGDLAAYLGSLARVRALDARTLLPAHGDPVSNPSALINAYIAHRRERDEQIVDAVATGCSTTAEIVRRVYPNLHGDLTWAAEESVLAHLTKLAREGRVEHAGGEWRLPGTYT